MRGGIFLTFRTNKNWILRSRDLTLSYRNKRQLSETLKTKLFHPQKKIDKTNLVYKKIIEPRNPFVNAEENKQSPIIPNLFERNKYCSIYTNKFL